MRISIKTLAAGSVAALALGAAAAPASAQSYGYGSGGDPLVEAIIRGVILATGDNDRYGYQDGAYRGPDCQYYRDGRCWRNLGHWEREHGINSRDRSYYGDRQYGRYVEGRTYAGRGYYRDGRFWRNHGQWRSARNHGRDYRYDRRW